MRRLILIFLCILLLCPTACAVGNAPYANARELWDFWCGEGSIPDYVTGVWCHGDPEYITFGLVPGPEGDAGREEILSLVADDSTVSFATQTHSYNYLRSIQDALHIWFDAGVGLMATWVDQMENVLVLEFQSDYQENPETLTLVEQLSEQYGELITIRFSDHFYAFAAAEAAPSTALLPVLEPTAPGSPLPVLLVLGMVVFLLLLVLRQRQRVLALREGDLPLREPLTTAQVEQRLRAEQPPVPRSLDDRMRKTLEKTDA